MYVRPTEPKTKMSAPLTPSGNAPTGNAPTGTPRKTVRFNLNGMDKVASTYRRAQTEFHRFSSEPAPDIPSVETVATSHTYSNAGDNDGLIDVEGDERESNDEEPDYVPSYEDYTEKVAPHLVRYRVKKTEIDEELQLQLAKLDEEYLDAMPCIPQTEKGKSQWKLGNRITYDAFKNLVDADQRLLFEEVRLAVLMNLSSRIVVTDVHHIAKKTNRSLSDLELWTEHMGQAMVANAEAYIKVKDGMSQNVRDWGLRTHDLNIKIGELQLAADDATAQVTEHAEAMVAMNIQRMKDRAKIIDLRKQLAASKGPAAPAENSTASIANNPAPESGEVGDPAVTTTGDNNAAPGGHPDDDDSSSDEDAGRGPLAGLPRSERQGTPGTTYTEYSEGGTRRQVKRSAKVPDPPAWHNDPEVDKNTYRVWRRKLENKLTTNADHYSTDAARQGAIEGYVDGPAANALAHYLDKDHPDRITTSAGLLAWLDNEFFNPHEKADAKVKFRTGLMMKNSDVFASYRNSFVATAGAIHLPKGEWKEEIHDRLADVPRLRNPLSVTFLDETKTFEDYCRLAQQLDADQRRQQLLRKKEDKPKDSTGGSRPPRNTNNQGTTTAAANPSTGRTTGLTRPARADDGTNKNAMEIAVSHGVSQKDLAARVEKNLCYNCGEDGHISKECPKRIAEREARRRAQISALDDAYAASTASNAAKLVVETGNTTAQGKN